MLRQIKTNEQIAREEGSGNIGQLASVAHRLEPPRQKDFVCLVFQLAFRAQLAMRLGLDGVPASAILDPSGMRSSTCVRSNIFGNRITPAKCTHTRTSSWIGPAVLRVNWMPWLESVGTRCDGRNHDRAFPRPRKRLADIWWAVPGILAAIGVMAL